MGILERRTFNRHIRERLGMTATELAKRVEVSRFTIHNYENGKQKTGYRPLERVIEMELDKAIEDCTDMRTHTLCNSLRVQRDTNT